MRILCDPTRLALVVVLAALLGPRPMDAQPLTPESSPAAIKPEAVNDAITIPEEDTDSILSNPGIGWESNNDVRSPALDPAETPPSRIAYFKYYLKTFLREDGMIDVSQLERDLERSRAAGQDLAFRLMAYGEEEGGEIMRAAGSTRGFNYRYEDGAFKGPLLWAPDLDDPQNLAILEKLLRKLGDKFDGHPALSHIDIGYVGLWGEWHTSDTQPRLKMPSEENQRRIIDMHFRAFPLTRKIMQLQDASALRYAIAKGAGIRGDCLGGPNTTMMKLYPLTLLAARADDAWKEAPVIFEICWTLNDWEKNKWNAAEIFDTALERYHASAINTKSTNIPPSLRPALDQFLRRAGYRFVLKRVAHPSSVDRHRRIIVQTDWENTGSAPCYDHFRPVLRLRPKGGGDEKRYQQSHQFCGRDLGKFSVELSIPPTTGLTPGEYELSVGITRGKEPDPQIAIAIKGGHNYWYPAGMIELH